jgi:pimeloyl-ACP methyl ester carboxylesterase
MQIPVNGHPGVAGSRRYVRSVELERGLMAAIPWAAAGAGPPVVVLAGLSPVVGVSGDAFVHAVLAPVRQLCDRRRVYVLNRRRRRHLPDALTMDALAAEHADALRSFFAGPVDLIGVSTGGSIAQQLAADHPDVVRRLVLSASTVELSSTRPWF